MVPHLGSEEDTYIIFIVLTMDTYCEQSRGVKTL